MALDHPYNAEKIEKQPLARLVQNKKKGTQKILFIQPAYAKYRRALFEKLHCCFDIVFYFLEEPEFHLQERYLKSFTFVTSSRIKRGRNHLVDIVRKYFDLLLYLIRSDYAVTITPNPLSPMTVISIFLSKIKKNKCIIWVEDWFMPSCKSLVSRFKFFPVLTLTKHVLRNAAAIIVHGTPQYNYVKNLGINDEKIFYANHCSTDYSKYPSKNLKKKLGIKRGLVVLYLGRIVAYKGLDVLIRAFYKIQQERNDTFLVVCGDGNFRPYCESLTEKLKMKQVIFKGLINEIEIASYYKTADIFVLPSCARQVQNVMLRAFAIRPSVEGWGLVINEAMSMGKPIITTDAVGAAQDLVKDNINGYIVKNGDADELFAALTKILKDRKLRETMGRNSRMIFEYFNNFDKMVEGFKKAIEYSISGRVALERVTENSRAPNKQSRHTGCNANSNSQTHALI